MPEGFKAGTASLSFIPSERPTQEPYRMNMGCVLLDQPTHSVAGVFTRNAFPGAPVIIGRQRIADASPVSGLLVNNKIANVSTKTGVEDARHLSNRLCTAAGLPEHSVFPVSTGIIGWSLPVPDMEEAIPQLTASLQGEQLLPVAQAMMTTDRYPKLRRVPLGDGSLVGLAKGAGMIEPNMGTMLIFLLTDVAFDRQEGQQVLQQVVDRTFNCISVDGDQSTSDMCLLLGSGCKGRVGRNELEKALGELCSSLAEDIVRNGEGTSHVIKLTVLGRKSFDEARGIGKAVINSPLVKTAIYGNDPNVGRILGAAGDYLGNNDLPVDAGKLTITIGGQTVFDRGSFTLDKKKEALLADYYTDAAMNPRLKGYPEHDRSVEITLDFHQGDAKALVLGSDLSNEYVHENADYRS